MLLKTVVGRRLLWFGQRPHDYNIDHSFPITAHPCGDAWKLTPASKQVNNQQANCLVTQGTVERAGNIIVDWWDSDEDVER